MLEDADGVLWVGTAEGLATIRNGVVASYGVRDGLPQATVYSLSRDFAGRLWVGTSGGLCQWDGVRCRPAGPTSAVFAARPTGPNEMTIVDGNSLTRVNTGTGHAKADGWDPGRFRARTLISDRDGNLWAGTFGQGLLRVRDGRADGITQREGLTGDLVQALLEDRDGNLWIGTSNGLDRFRSPRFTRVSVIEGLSGSLCTAVLVTRDQSVWVGVAGTGLDRLRPENSVAHYGKDQGLQGSTVFSLVEDQQGRLWAGTSAGLFRRTGERFVPVPLPSGDGASQIVAMAEGKSGTLWLGDMRKGILRVRDSRAETASDIPVVAGGTVYALHVDAEENLWIGYLQGGVSVVGGGTNRFFAPGKQITGGAVEAIEPDPDGSVWVGSAEGLSRFRRGQWTTWRAGVQLPPGSVQRILTGDPTDLWLASTSGLLRLRRRDLDASAGGALASVPVDSFGPADGVRFPNGRRMVSPRMDISSNGRIWISTDDGLAGFDSRQTSRIQAPPSVVFERVAVDRRPVPFTDGLPRFRGLEIEIEFAAPNLSMPEGVRFRHKLEGRDTDWSALDAGRRIVYSGLPARQYRFRAMAVTADGVTSAPADFVFERLPYYYETRLFYAAVAAAAGLLAYAAHRIRVRSLQARFRVALAERSRVGRELHDNLLQGFVGVVYLLAAASKRLDRDGQIDRAQLQLAIEQADRSLKEGREAISCMRLSALENHTLAEALIATGRQVVKDTPIVFEHSVAGGPRQLSYETEANLFIIGREAMYNAMAHAKPRRITLRLTYARRSVLLVVSDDGEGFDPVVGAGRENHWGLVGMRERARQIGGEFRITSEVGRGAIVEVAVPIKPNSLMSNHSEVKPGVIRTRILDWTSAIKSAFRERPLS